MDNITLWQRLFDWDQTKHRLFSLIQDYAKALSASDVYKEQHKDEIIEKRIDESGRTVIWDKSPQRTDEQWKKACELYGQICDVLF